MEYVITIAAIILLVAVEFSHEIVDVVLSIRRRVKRAQEGREKAAIRSYWAAKG